MSRGEKAALWRSDHGSTRVVADRSVLCRACLRLVGQMCLERERDRAISEEKCIQVPSKERKAFNRGRVGAWSAPPGSSCRVALGYPFTIPADSFSGCGAGGLHPCANRRVSILVDCGSSNIEDVWRKRVSQALQYYGIDRLDGVFVSHGDADHVNGLRAWLSAYDRNLLGDNCADVSCDMLFLGPAARAGTAAATEEGSH